MAMGKMMGDLILSGYATSKEGWMHYVLNPDEGLIGTICYLRQKDGHIKETFSDAIEVPEPCGFGEMKKVWRWIWRKRLFFAIYSTESSLWLWISGRKIDLLDSGVKVIRFPLLFWHLWMLFEPGKGWWHCWYRYLDDEDVPDEDILWYIARNTESYEHRVKTYLLWRDRAENRDVYGDGYAEELDERARIWIEDHSRSGLSRI